MGVVGHAHRVPKPFGELSVTGSPTWYVDGLVAVGARAVLLPGPEARDLLDVVDALILTGGGDVDPAHHCWGCAGASRYSRSPSAARSPGVCHTCGPTTGTR